MLLLLLLWAPSALYLYIVCSGFVNNGCHWLQQEQIVYASIPSVWFAIPMSLFGILLYELRVYISQHPIHFLNAASNEAVSQPLSNGPELLLDVIT